MNNEANVFRSIAFPVNTFDYLKQFQRDYHRQYGTQLNNNQALATILLEHQQINVESEEHGSYKPHE
jgi:hypothetical protein